MTDRKPVGLSSIHGRHLELGAALAESAGWQVPVRYSSAQDEAESARRAVGLCDVSSDGKLLVQGEDLGRVLGPAIPGFGDLAVGHVLRMPSEGNKPDGEVSAARLAADEALVVTAPGGVQPFFESLETSAELCAHTADVSSALAAVIIAGPSAQRLLAQVTELDTTPMAFPDMSCAQGKVAEVHGLLLRCDMPGLTTFRLYCGREFGEHMWDSLAEAGHELGASPFGAEALALLQ